MSTTLLSILAITAAVCLGFYVLLLRRHRSLNIIFLALGLLLMAVVEGADLFALTHPDLWVQAKSVAIIFESFLGLAWLLFAATYARKNPFRNLSVFSWALLLSSILLPLVALNFSPGSFFYSPDFAEEHVLFLSRTSYWFYLGFLFFIVVALYQLERTLMAFSAMERSVVLYEILGISILLVVLMIYYSQALLHRTIDMNLIPVRSLALLFGVCLYGYSHYKRGSATGIRISRTVATQSVVVLAVGSYLFLLGGVREAMRYIGLQGERLTFIGFAVISGIGIASLLFSDKYRRRLNVFLYKHFYRHKYDYRKEWLMFTAQLSSAENLEKLQNAILNFYCETFGRKGASLYLRNDESGHYHLKSCLHLEFPETCFIKDNPLINYLGETQLVFNARDRHPAQFDNLKRRFKEFNVDLCVPLQHEQHLEGFILIGETVSSDDHLIFEDYDLMKVLARQSTSVLLSLKLATQLVSAHEMAAIGKMSTFVIHDLKNYVSGLTLMVDNAREHINNPEFQADMLEALDEAIGKVNVLITRLKNIKEKKDLNLALCDLADIVRKGVKASGQKPKMAQGEKVPVLVDAGEIEKVVHNLLLNAQEAGSRKGLITINVGLAESAFFEVTDQGVGMTDDFIRNRLFQPFQTSKKEGLGVGLYQCRQIIEAHGGKIEVSSKVGDGTTFKVHLPAVVD